MSHSDTQSGWYWVDPEDGTEFFYLRKPTDRPSTKIERTKNFDFCTTLNAYQYDDQIHRYLSVRPLGEDWQSYDERSDKRTVWRRPRL